MTILAIDPGPINSGWAIMRGGKIASCGVSDNHAVIELRNGEQKLARTAIEHVACYGMPVGRDVFETCVWIGRIVQSGNPSLCRKVYRRDVKHHLCGSAKAKDANVRQAIIDRYPATGGGKTPQIGTKAKPGPLYGVKSHAWAAIGVGIVANDKWDELESF